MVTFRFSVCVAVMFMASFAHAGGPVRSVLSKIAGRNASCSGASAVEPVGSVEPVRSGGLAQQKAEVQASQGRMRHIGGSFGAGRFEGVGFSTVSAQAAIQACCYYGRKTPVDIGVARGERGWYATVLYK